MRKHTHARTHTSPFGNNLVKFPLDLPFFPYKFKILLLWGSWLRGSHLGIPSSSFCEWTKNCMSQRKGPLKQEIEVTVGERGSTDRLTGRDLRQGT